jgi:hypothetical protein
VNRGECVDVGVLQIARRGAIKCAY